MQVDSISAWPVRPARGTRLKRAACIALFVLGLCFWVPALLRAKLDASAATENAAVDPPPQADAVWSTQISEAPAAISSPSGSAGHASALLKSKLHLTTTILGKTRRAAIVNGRLYREGDKIVAGSEHYRLASVAEGRIELVALGPNAGSKHSVLLDPAADIDRDPSVSR